MRTLATTLVVALLVAGSAFADDPAPTAQTEGTFCTGKPDQVDTRAAAAVNALSVGGAPTGPIAILDTGVSATATEIGDRIVSPFDVSTGDEDGSDFIGHGTEVAGIAAGIPGLVQGVSPGSPIMPVRVFNRVGDSVPQWITAGVNWAATHGAVAINISVTDAEDDVSATDMTAMTRAIDEAANKNIVVVASVGNDGKNIRSVPAVLPHVLTVGGAALNGLRASFSNWGTFIDLVAPAANLIGPVPTEFCGTGYGVANGTSFAAPAVAAAAALLAARHPDYTLQQRLEVLKASAHDVPPVGREEETGFGMLNVGAALNATPPAPEASAEVDDDPYFVRGANAVGHPTLLVSTKKVRLAGSLSAIKDPSDVYPVRLKKGERLSVSASVGNADSLVALGLWKPTVGDFDVSAGNTKQQLTSTGGFSTTPALVMRAKSAGTYFISVEAPDAIDPDDADVEAPYSQTYQLSVSKSPPVKKTVKKKSTKKKSTKKKQ